MGFWLVDHLPDLNHPSWMVLDNRHHHQGKTQAKPYISFSEQSPLFWEAGYALRLQQLQL